MMRPRSSIDRQLARRFSPFARFRMMRGLLQSDVAARAGIHETVMSKLERGVRRATEDQERACAKALRSTLRRTRELLEESRRWARQGARGRRS